DTGLRKARIIPNTDEDVSQRDLNAICKTFHDVLNVEVARNSDAIHAAVTARFAAVRERLTSVSERFRQLPRNTAWPETLTRLERALESCRRDRKVKPTLIAVKRNLSALRDGITLLRRMETDLTEATTETLRQAEDAHQLCWPGLQALGADPEVRAAATDIAAHLVTERAWEDAAELRPKVELVRTAYRIRRKAILDAHAHEVELLIERLKLRDGFEKLDPDQRHQVVRHLSEGALAGTDEKAVAPPIEALEALLAAKRAMAESKALAQLDGFLNIATVDVALNVAGREIKSEAELDLLLDEIRRRVLHELGSKHRVRLK
ncbi:MAG TPA: hypothetical protein PLI95_28325, partial [Polyangiaceae bacterium]|nr:hypothetical protein [Polyangiaceae bacterium]